MIKTFKLSYPIIKKGKFLKTDISFDQINLRSKATMKDIVNAKIGNPKIEFMEQAINLIVELNTDGLSKDDIYQMRPVDFNKLSVFINNIMEK